MYSATNITNHICKVHAGAFVTAVQAAACGLAACSCGQAVLNEAALKQHQGIHKCQQTQQSALQSPVEVALPCSQEQGVLGMQATEDQALRFTPEDEELADVVPATLSWSPTPDMDAPTLPDIPEPEPEPEPEPPSLAAEDFDMPEKRIVIFLMEGEEEARIPPPELLVDGWHRCHCLHPFKTGTTWKRTQM